MTQPLVSIALASYNGEKYIEQQLKSIAAQTYPHLEIVISDDNSTDGTREIITAFAQSDKRVRLLLNEQNKGYNKNFESAFLHTTGGYIAIADQDDIWLPEKLEEQMKLFTSENVLLVHSASVRFSGNEVPEKKDTSAVLFEGNDVLKLALRNSVSGHNIIFRRSLLNTALPFPADTFYDWWLVQNAASTGIVAACSKVHVHQRAHDQNVTVRKRTTKNQTEEEYTERKAALNNFLNIKGLKETDRKILTALKEKFLLLENASYSPELFRFFMQYRHRLFFYKKGLLAYFSQKKAAKRMSFREP
jgi:glycosyltransferase involved in cell wall biosynthesis